MISLKHQAGTRKRLKTKLTRQCQLSQAEAESLLDEIQDNDDILYDFEAIDFVKRVAPQPSNQTQENNMIDKLMREITDADIRPSVFKVHLIATDHTARFIAYVDFRTNVRGPSSLEAHGDTSEEALTILRDTLTDRLGKCEHCGRYPSGEDIE